MGRVFNPGFLNSCTLKVSVLLEMGPPEIWDAEQEATTPGFREEVVGDFFFFHRSGLPSLLPATCSPGCCALLSLEPTGREKQGTKHGG